MKTMNALIYRLIILCGLLFAAACAPALQSSIPIYDFVIVHTFPHDSKAFTQGLIFRDGFLYESTGLNGSSSIRKVNIDSGRVLQQRDLPQEYFGEGLTVWKDELYGITWKSHVGFVFDLSTFSLKRQFSYAGEGWGLTHDDSHLFLSDGTSVLRVLAPPTMQEVRRIQVTANGHPVDQLNELEWIEGEIFANIWQSDLIARIDPLSGRVVGWIDLTGLLQSQERTTTPADVLNGIAYDSDKKRLFVTGKLWPKLFEIALVQRQLRRKPA
ncbi:MAG: glutaminyl-peptide cyclotransferase [Acidobacteria bacterium]|nr:glutaminyl-peptide cyclotransferase [Acidobacteriota bacterium]